MTQQELPLRKMISGASISENKRYRWFLWRIWDGSLPGVVFIMLNPSTADGKINDQTIRKCIGFAERWGCGAIYVVNLFAYRATDPDELRVLPSNDAVGYQNDEAIREILARSKLRYNGPVVCAWGSQPEAVLAGRPFRIQVMAKEVGLDLQCFGLTQKGHPRHPLMLPYETELQPWA